MAPSSYHLSTDSMAQASTLSPLPSFAPWPFSITDQAFAIKLAYTTYKVPEQVFMGMYNNETSLGSNVQPSSAGAIGPFQFEPGTAKTYNYPLTDTPNYGQFQQQANAAAHYLSDLYNQLSQSWRNALAGYNAGAGNYQISFGYADQALAFQIPSAWTSALGASPSSATNVSGGGVAGLSGTGVAPNAPAASGSLWYVGDSTNPDQDYWTTINQYSQDAQLYTFSDGEALIVADGFRIMGQTPTAYIRRDDPAVIGGDLTYDNCLALDTPIPTPNGWTTMGALSVGERVLGSDGRPVVVIGKSDVHEGHACYRVSFSDASSIVSDDGHQWATIIRQRYRGVRTTLQIRNTLRLDHQICLPTPLSLSEAIAADQRYVTITAVDPVPSVPVSCIMVDAADQLFLAGESSIPTHNTSFNYTHTSVLKGSVVRQAVLTKTPSPTQVEVQIICDIDQFRGGDIVYLRLWGPADGPWLVGTCERSIFQPYSKLTLVQATTPLNANSGLPLGPTYLTGTTATATTGSVINRMVSEAASINNKVLPYVLGGGHANAGTPSGGPPPGFDCSGCVGAVLYAGGLIGATNVPTNNGIISELTSGGKLITGEGAGQPECSLFNGPNHIFMRLNGVYFGTSNGYGGPNNTAPKSFTTPVGGGGGGGGSWLTGGPDVGTFQRYHILPSVLGQQANTTNVVATASTSGYQNPVPGWTPGRIDQGVDGTLSSQGYVAPGTSRILIADSSNSGWGGGGYIAAELLDGNNQGYVYYIAEGIHPASGITVGAQVAAGTQLVVRIDSPYNSILGNIETGWAQINNPGVPLAQQLAGYSGDQSSAAITAGSAFNSFIVAAGGAGGTVSPGAGANDPTLLPSGPL